MVPMMWKFPTDPTEPWFLFQGGVESWGDGVHQYLKLTWLINEYMNDVSFDSAGCQHIMLHLIIDVQLLPTD